MYIHACTVATVLVCVANVFNFKLCVTLQVDKKILLKKK